MCICVLMDETKVRGRGILAAWLPTVHGHPRHQAPHLGNLHNTLAGCYDFCPILQIGKLRLERLDERQRLGLNSGLVLNSSPKGPGGYRRGRRMWNQVGSLEEVALESSLGG